MKSLTGVREDNDHQTPRTDYLKKSAYSLAFEEQDERTSQQRAPWRQCD